MVDYMYGGADTHLAEVVVFRVVRWVDRLRNQIIEILNSRRVLHAVPE